MYRVAGELTPDVVRIRWHAGTDWSGHSAIYFRVILSDDASRRDRLAEVARRVRQKHLLVEEAATLWNGSKEARTGIGRAFHHGSMKSASLQFSKAEWHDWHCDLRAVPLALQQIASAFVDPQDDRVF